VGRLAFVGLMLALGCSRPEPPLEVTYWYLRD
jgi:hypothetical protein